MKITKSAIDPATDPRVNRQAMKKKTLSLAAGFAALLFASSSIASSNPVISSSSENSVRISSAKVVRALGGGSYVTGTIEPSFGYVAPDDVDVHVAAYDANGKLLAEKVDKIDANDLVSNGQGHCRDRMTKESPAWRAKALVREFSDSRMGSCER